MINFLKNRLNDVRKTGEILRKFSYENKTIVETFFIILYSGLQIYLVVLAYLFPKHITLFVAIFAILILTIFALHKIVMESRIRILENGLRDMISERFNIMKKIGKMVRPKNL
tara:strand:+ start:219 stop:557 length:339 start_codon:yes stop_codon:yes gene_type:complete